MEYTNKLSIVLLATKREYEEGVVFECLDKYFKVNASIDKKIDLHIFFNKGNESEYSNLLDYKNCQNIHEIKIKSHNLEGLEDLYARNPQELQKLNLQQLPALGGSSGPNNLFFDSMIPIMDQDYRDYLMIECDTQPLGDFWLDKIIEYCDTNTFMISGSTYKGDANLPVFELWTGHLNGVAIYRSSEHLSFFLKFSKQTISHYVKNNLNHFISFDVGMHYFSATNVGKIHFNNPLIPQNHLINCDIIANYSLPCDTNLSIEEIKEKHPKTIILHKKWN